MKITFCWSAISGYMAACWRELASRAGVRLHVIAHRPTGSDFSASLMEGVSHRFLDEGEAADVARVEELVAETHPDVVAMTGWWLKPYRSLLLATRLGHAKFIMGIDSPWRTELQYLSRLRYWRYLNRVDQFFVTGERSWQYMKKLGVPPARISRGMYGVDAIQWSAVHHERAGRPWPRRFLFLGRYDREKAVDVLVAAYRQYRRRVAEPWQLMCCGQGRQRTSLEGVEGIEDLGFRQPAELGEIFLQAGVFVMPSRFDPWPLALVEACAAGLPVICSDACGSAVEHVRPLYNGFIVGTGSVEDLADALAEIHAIEPVLPEWGRRSHELAAAYSAEVWADRWISTCRRLVGQEPLRA